MLVDDIDTAMAIADGYAAEHLEIQTHDARERAMSVRNAGAVFVGNHTLVSLATTRRAPTTCCPPAAAPVTRPA